MSYTFSWEIKSELDPRDFIQEQNDIWEEENESEDDFDFDSDYSDLANFDIDEIL